MVKSTATKMSDRGWRNVTVALVAIWIVAMARLMIADVWDETNGLVVFRPEGMPLGVMVKSVLTRSLGIWRPIPTLFAALVIRFTGFEIAWRLLRALNMAMMLGTVAILVSILDRWRGPSKERTALFTLTVLYSAAAVLCAGWFADIFDVTSMLLIAVGLWLITRERFVAAGTVIGAGFFFKETTALALPFLLMLLAAGRITFRQMLRVAIPATAFGVLYFALRSAVIPFGSAADTHQFLPADFVPTLLGIVDAWWRQTLWGSGPGLIGISIFVASLAAFRTWSVRGAFLLLVLAAVVIYWSMFSVWQNGVLIHYLMFVPRLLYVPVTLTLFLVALDGRRWALPLLAIPLLYGAVTTYQRYERFQRSYKHVYKAARRSAEKPLKVFYPMKPLSDPVRGLEIGDIPEAQLKIDPVNGKLVPRG